MNTNISRRLLFCFCLLLRILGAEVLADESVPSLAQYNHTSWTARDGAPGDMWALARSSDGWLWLGGPTGLYRFDGIRFERVEIDGLPPDRSQGISVLYATDEGDLWIGYTYGGVSLMRAGQFRHFGAEQGMGRGSVVSFAQDREGAMWVASSDALRRLNAERWEAIGTDWNFPDAYANAVAVDRRGALWVAGEREVFVLNPGTRAFQRAGLQFQGQAEFVASSDGREWLADDGGVTLLPRQSATSARDLQTNARTSHVTLLDRNDRLWWLLNGVKRLSLGSGNTRSKSAAGTESFDSREGLTEVVTKTLIEDVDGNIWVTTSNGLDRLRPTNVRRLPPSVSDLGFVALVPAGNGDVWIGSKGGNVNLPTDGLWRYHDGELHRIGAGTITAITAATRDSNGSLVVAGPGGIWRQRSGDEFHELAELPGGPAEQLIHAITIDARGELWMSIVRSSLFRWRNGVWEINGGLADLPKQRPQVHALDPEGRIWFGYRDGTIAVVDHDRVEQYTAADGLGFGAIFALQVGRYTIAAGENKAALLSDGKFRELRTAAPAVLEGVTGMVEADDAVWFNTFHGAVRIAMSDLERARADATYRLPYELFDPEDGFPGMAQRIRPVPTLIRADDGRLWFAGTTGVGWLDPARIHRDLSPPPVVIRSLLANGEAHASDAPIQLSSGTRDLQVDYTALNLTRSENVRFRYRLEGADQDWIDAGGRREAFYTNLGPGQYQFRVAAMNPNGAWSESGAAVDITIPPTFVQTKTFAALGVGAVIASLWLAYAWRIRKVTARVRARLQERLTERERIARELHDTLLQNMQGVILKLQNVAEEIPADAPARRMMEQALDRADEVLIDGRDRVKDLRESQQLAPDLPDALNHAAAELIDAGAVEFSLAIEGAARPLHPIVREEAFQIAREALANALRHAHATKIEAEVAYAPRELCIRVRDDGRGIDQEVLRAGGRPDHWGLVGMQERATKIRGRLNIWSGRNTGTEIELRVPGQIAYVSSRARRFQWPWFRGSALFLEH